MTAPSEPSEREAFEKCRRVPTDEAWQIWQSAHPVPAGLTEEQIAFLRRLWDFYRSDVIGTQNEYDRKLAKWTAIEKALGALSGE